jgi:hypothetical protein
MKAYFMKGIDKSHPNVWVSTNFFYRDNQRSPNVKANMKKISKVLKENGFKSKMCEFEPRGWGIRVHCVGVELDEADEAYFVLLTHDGIDI